MKRILEGRADSFCARAPRTQDQFCSAESRAVLVACAQ